MTKLDYELKLKVVTEYLHGKSSVTLEKEFGISRFSVFNWVQLFRKDGTDGLKVRTASHEYDADFKLEVLQWKQKNHSTYSQAASYFDISNPGTIANWQRKYDDLGYEGLFRKNIQQVILDRKRLDELEHENKLLRLENSYLRRIKISTQLPATNLKSFGSSTY